MGELSIIDFFDPRGRANRKGFAVVAAVLVGAQAGLYGAAVAEGATFTSGLTEFANILLVWLAFAGTSKRLHDLGHSVWRLAAVIIMMVVWCFALSFGLVLCFGESGFEPGASGWIAAVAGTLLPLALLLMWIHCAAGEAGPNRFGPAPGTNGFSRGPTLPAASLANA